MAAEVDDVATCRRAHPPLAKVTDDYRRGNHAMIAEARGAYWYVLARGQCEDALRTWSMIHAVLVQAYSSIA